MPLPPTTKILIGAKIANRKARNKFTVASDYLKESNRVWTLERRHRCIRGNPPSKDFWYIVLTKRVDHFSPIIARPSKYESVFPARGFLSFTSRRHRECGLFVNQ